MFRKTGTRIRYRNRCMECCIHKHEDTLKSELEARTIRMVDKVKTGSDPDEMVDIIISEMRNIDYGLEAEQYINVRTARRLVELG